MSMATKVQCVAVLGKRNNPLYLRVFKHYEEKLKCHYVVHTSLDVVDERSLLIFIHLSLALAFLLQMHMNNTRWNMLKRVWGSCSTAARSDKQGYLGLLLTNEDSKVYGYITCTQTKFIAVLDEVGAKEDNAKKVCLHKSKHQSKRGKHPHKQRWVGGSSLRSCTSATSTLCRTRSMSTTRRLSRRPLTAQSPARATASLASETRGTSHAQTKKPHKQQQLSRSARHSHHTTQAATRPASTLLTAALWRPARQQTAFLKHR